VQCRVPSRPAELFFRWTTNTTSTIPATTPSPSCTIINQNLMHIPP
jgi:hypothetical protein